MTRSSAALIVCVLLSSTGRAQLPTFRSSAATVAVDVSVAENGADVSNLTAKDFRVTDNGVPQTVTNVSRQALPVDVTFVADISGLREGALLDSFRRAIDDVLARLGADDRASLVLFDPRIRELTGLERSRVSIRAERQPSSGGAAALLDAIAASVIRASDPGRRRMAVVFSDGQDAGSALDERDVLDVASRNDVTVFAVTITDGTTRTPQRPANGGFLTAIADATGGAVAVVQRDQDVSASFIRAFNAFRTSYVLQYTPTGVPEPGWHNVEVGLTRSGRFEIRARKGYFGEADPAAP